MSEMSDCRVSVLHSEDYRTTAWSGGTTTELSISPENSVYADRDFEWRFSSATVELEESDFTSLPDYNRIILTLKGGIRLSHNGGEWITLPEFAPHSFNGGDSTKSVGKVTDFNLMLKKGVCDGLVIPCLLKKGESQKAEKVSRQMNGAAVFLLYCYEGALTVSSETGTEYHLNSGDSLKVIGTFHGAGWSWQAETDVSAIASAVIYV